MIGYQCSPSSVRAPVTSSAPPTTGYHSSASSPTSSVASSSSSVASSSSSVSSSASRSPVSPNLLDYYPEINQDGLSLSWFHQANNRARLSEALMTNRMIVAGDISLTEMSRYPVPIMAKPPLGVSDITLENWLQEMVGSPRQKGIKLTFTSTRTVEPAFRVLARHAENLKGPLILDADILSRPDLNLGGCQGSRIKQQQLAQQNQQPVDAWTFLMLCRTRFPTSTISIGWCSGNSNSSSSSLANSFQSQDEPNVVGSHSPLHSSADSMFDLIAASQHVHLSNQLNSRLHQLHHLSHHHNHHHHHHHSANALTHHILSSTGSLHSSSSGNSSGSPSPTSPIGHHHHGSSPPHQVAAAAAAMAAAVAAATSFQEMPLNLNINEASFDTTTTTTTSAATTTTNTTRDNSTTTSKLGLSGQSSSAILSQLTGLQHHANGSLHIHKKAAVSSATNSNTPSPQSSSSVGSQRRQSITSTPHLGLLKTTSNTPSATCNPSSLSNHQVSSLGLNSTQQQQQARGGYTREMIDKMASIVKEYNLTQPVTFPVEAKLLKNSLGELQRLLYQVGPNSTLTVVAKQSDLISVDELISIRKAFATNQILFDLPDELAASLRRELF